jgi:hypothetical protein
MKWSSYRIEGVFKDDAEENIWTRRSDEFERVR